MKKLITVVLVSILIIGSGLVESPGFINIKLKGSQKNLSAPVLDMISSAANLVEQTLPWAETMTLKVQKGGKDQGYAVPKANFEQAHAKALEYYDKKISQAQEEYEKKLEQAQHYRDEGKTDQYAKKLAEAKEEFCKKVSKAEEELETKGYHFTKKYDGFGHVQLVGTITGDDGQKKQIIIDADTSRNVTSGVTVIGSNLLGHGKQPAALDRDATVQNGVLQINRDVYTSGPFNATQSTTVWNNNALVSGDVTTATRDTSSQQGFLAQGTGSYQQTVLSNNYIIQHSQIQVAVPPNGHTKHGQ